MGTTLELPGGVPLFPLVLGHLPQINAGIISCSLGENVPSLLCSSTCPPVSPARQKTLPLVC